MFKIALWILKKYKRQVLQEAVKELYCGVTSDDILKENPDGTIRFEDKILTPDYKKNLREQAEIFDKLMLWKVLKKDVEYQLRKKMFEEAKCDLDVVWGQLATFLWDVIEDRLRKLRKTTT